MKLDVQKNDEIGYEVPMIPYFVSISVSADRAGYEKIKLYIQRNISRALLLGDRENVNHFKEDWSNLIETFHNLDIINDEYVNSEKLALQTFEKTAAAQGVRTMKRCVKTVASNGLLKKIILGGLVGGGVAYLLTRASATKGIQ